MIPKFVIQRVYKQGSLRYVTDGVAFDIHNQLAPANMTGAYGVTLNDTLHPPEQFAFELSGETRPAVSITAESPLFIPYGALMTCIIAVPNIDPGNYTLVLDLASQETGRLSINLSDVLNPA